ncbi:MAG: NADH-quinone oxidoreductase subunit M [Nitrospirae bacterium]|nr:NADH-quinone oxidoreductase subunit M [Nitrospirota bacterium]MCL5238038.1 NADH-quinone oxidoreductase subunit M [Nitrospirota bacterium]
MSYPILSTVIFLPIVGAIFIFLIKRTSETLIKWTALLLSLLTFALSLPLFTDFDKTTAGMQFRETADWIPAWGIKYALGVDGISVLFVLLSTLLAILCVTISWNSIKLKTKEFYAALLLIEGSMIGVFCSLDLFLFYIFWEAMLIPMYLLIGIWGGPNRIYAAIKFFLFTLVGSVLMLVGIIVLYLNTGRSFDILQMMATNYPYDLQVILFWAFFAAFAVKVPMFPVHTWLPDAHTEAPTAGSVILAGILIKMGAYGFLRFNMPILPEATKAMAPAMMVLSVIAIIYGAVICLGQTDLKRLIAYSSVSHMGFVTLGLFALNMQGLQGGILQMINHGVVTGALFLSVGVIYDRTHTRQIADYGGAASVLPVYAAFFMVFTLASIGLPATNGFIGEFLIILGGFTASKVLGTLSATGIILGAAYMLWLYQRVFFMEVNPKLQGYKDMDMREILTLVPLLILVFWIGVYPNTFLSFMDASVQNLINRVNTAGQPQTAQHIIEVIK